MQKRRKDTGEAPVPYEEAARRACAWLSRMNRPAGLSEIGCAIWPKRTGKAQGFALAAGRLVNRMMRDGLVRYMSERRPSGFEQRGYLITLRGREWLKVKSEDAPASQ
jgi:hypothetical protein